MKDLIIVGAGPAGMTAVIYARRAGLDVLVFEAKTYGGQIINSSEVANYPAIEKISGMALAQNMYVQAEALGAEFEFEKVEAITKNEQAFVVETEDEKYEARSVIIATGSSNRPLGVEGEEKFIGRGISYCATCDGNFYKNKRVAVVGGGNTAFDDVEYLSRLAEKVYLIHRREGFRAEQQSVDKIKALSNVEFVLNATVEELIGDDKINGVKIKQQGESREIKIDGLFVAIGQTPQNAEFKDFVKLDSYGYIKADENCHTNIEGLFVAGDNRTKELRQLVTATSDGAIAASEVVKYLN